MKSTTDKVTETTVKPIVWESGLISIDDDFSAAVGRVSYDSYKVMTKILPLHAFLSQQSAENNYNQDQINRD